MKRAMIILCMALLWCCACTAALADSAGVLSEKELIAWVNQALRDSAVKQPMNAPVGEEALTEDGYAFLYDFATLYYDKPQLDANSVLQGAAFTAEEYAGPRGLHLGSSSSELIDVFGWQNPALIGDGHFAVLYCLDALPASAYWSWAQYDEYGELLQVQCAVHVQIGGSYTDAGLRFNLTDGMVTSMQLYGLTDLISESEVRANLSAVRSVEAAAFGDEWVQESITGYTVLNQTAPFALEDLSFSGMDYLTLNDRALAALLGADPQTQRVQDDNDVLVNDDWSAVSLVRTQSGADWRVESLTVNTAEIIGPRGLRVGESQETVLALFASDGQGRTRDGIYAILYGDGESAPYALLEQNEKETIVSYTISTDETDVTLGLTFIDGVLQTWTLYTW